MADGADRRLDDLAESVDGGPKLLQCDVPLARVCSGIGVRLSCTRAMSPVRAACLSEVVVLVFDTLLIGQLVDGGHGAAHLCESLRVLAAHAVDLVRDPSGNQRLEVAAPCSFSVINRRVITCGGRSARRRLVIGRESSPASCSFVCGACPGSCARKHDESIRPIHQEQEDKTLPPRPPPRGAPHRTTVDEVLRRLDAIEARDPR